jgi:hypothetical protein
LDVETKLEDLSTHSAKMKLNSIPILMPYGMLDGHMKPIYETASTGDFILTQTNST